MGLSYRRFHCLNPKCWFSSMGRKGKWRLYYTKNHLKLECRSCGFILRFPFNCAVCGAEGKIQGGFSGVTMTYRIQDVEYVQIKREEEIE